MILLSQRDPRWKDIKLGFSNTTIGDYGCTITALSMILGTTPDVANERLKAVQGFAQGNLVIWAKLEEAFPGIKIKRVWTYDNEDVKKNVPNVLVEVDGKPIGGYRHWVVYIGNGKMIDPWDGKEKSTASYPNPLSYCVIGGKWNKPSPVEDTQKIIDQLRLERDTNHNLYKDAVRENEEFKKQLQEINAEYEGVKQELFSFRAIVKTYADLLGVGPTETEKIAGQIKKLVEFEDQNSTLLKEIILVKAEKEVVENSLEFSKKEIEIIKQEREDSRAALQVCVNDKKKKLLKDYSWLTRFFSLFRR